MRLYVARDLGFVLPLIEILSNDGVVHGTFESREFSQRPGGYYVPNFSEMVVEPNGENPYRLAYEIRSVRDLNQTIPDAAFVLDLPEGTQGSDRRPGDHSIPFDVKGGVSLPPDLRELAPLLSRPESRFTTLRAIGVGVTIGIVLLLGAIALRRRLK